MLGSLFIGGIWLKSHLTPLEDDLDDYLVVILYSPEAVLNNVVSVTLVAHKDRIRFFDESEMKEGVQITQNISTPKDENRRRDRGNLLQSGNTNLFRANSVKLLKKELTEALDAQKVEARGHLVRGDNAHMYRLTSLDFLHSEMRAELDVLRQILEENEDYESDYSLADCGTPKMGC